MSDSSEFFRSGGKPRVLRVTTSGTFTPSAAHLARGGVVTITASGGGGSGALSRITSGSTPAKLGGSCAGERVRRTVALVGAVSYTVGAGGAARSATGTAVANLAGNDGGDTVVTGVLTAKGGKGGLSTITFNKGGDGAGGLGAVSATSGPVDARGGVGVDGTNGGGGGAISDLGIPWAMTARDGGGDGVNQNAATVGTILPGINATAGTGAGGGAISVVAASSENLTVTSGAGASGWIEFTWSE